MGTARALMCPAELTNLSRAFVAEESTASERHDVRGKLASVRNGAYFIRRKLEGFPQLLASDERVLQFLDLIDDELETLGDRLHSRLRTPQEVRAEPIDLARHAMKLLTSLELPADIEVRAPVTTGRVRTNPDELSLALFCLVENAVESMVGSPKKILTVDVEGREDKLLSLAVEDTGAGITRELREQMFRPFFTTRPEHLGVGLKIARRIARRWDGELQVLTPRAGARLAICLPELSVEHRRSGAGRSVLLVDDKDTARFALRALLEADGYNVVESGSVAQARERLGHSAYDLMIIDLHLGDGLGTELLDDVKRTDRRPVVVMLSGSEPPQVNGISLYLTKATAPELILSSLAQALSGARA
jgi:CheY-like chemotaxis protein